MKTELGIEIGLRNTEFKSNDLWIKMEINDMENMQ